MASERGLGRGLDSLFKSTTMLDEGTDGNTTVTTLVVSQLLPGAHQPRKVFNESALKELAASLKNQGIIQPLIVRLKEGSQPKLYEIVAGERRYRAAKMAGLTELPVIISTYTDTEAMTIALVENLQREDLNPMEEAEALNTIKETHNLSQEELAAKLGKSRPAVANALRLINLPEKAKQAISQGELSAGHARPLLSITDINVQMELLDIILEQKISVREVEAALDCWKRNGKLPESMQIKEDSSKGGKQNREKKPLQFVQLQSTLRKSVHYGALVSGSSEKGKIVLPFAGHEELEHLLHILGLEEYPVDSSSTKNSKENVSISPLQAAPASKADAGVNTSTAHLENSTLQHADTQNDALQTLERATEKGNEHQKNSVVSRNLTENDQLSEAVENAAVQLNSEAIVDDNSAQNSHPDEIHAEDQVDTHNSLVPIDPIAQNIPVATEESTPIDPIDPIDALDNALNELSDSKH